MRQALAAPKTKEVLAQVEQALEKLPAQKRAIFINQLMAELIKRQADCLRNL